MPIYFVCTIATSVYASTAAPATAQEGSHGALEEIIVSSRPLGERYSDVGQSISVLASEALERARAGTLGATLDHLPGLAQSSFGPAVSRPVIRGLSGDRIRILTNGLGSIDASSTSPDHGLAIDPEQAEKIEILKGPATLLYGGNAVGGAISVYDGRIPLAQPEGGLKGYAHGHWGSNGNEVSLSGGSTISVRDNLALHADASYLDRGDLEIPGFAEVASLREGEEAPERGTIEGTSSRRYGTAIGANLFGDNGFIGASVSYFDHRYGLPGGEEHHGAEDGDEHGEEGGPIIDLEQTRFDLMSEWQVDEFGIEQINVRFGYGDYSHNELEGSTIATRFLNEGYEGRLELIHKASEDHSGALGVQIRHRDFEAIGEEAFTPASVTDQYGLFLLEKWHHGRWAFEGGARLDLQEIEADTLDRNFTALSFSASATYDISDTWQITANGYRSERAPNAEELLSDGPHFATSQFELGNRTLGEETALGGELRLTASARQWRFSATYFFTDYDDFIFQSPTGAIEDGLPVASYSAVDARFQGFEAEARWEMLESAAHSLTLALSADYVRASQRASGEPLPRIPPLSTRAELFYEGNRIDFHIGLSLVDRQDRTAAGLLPTSGFADLTAGITYHPTGPDGLIKIYLEGDNLLDETIRHASSFLKDTLPEAGANVRLGMKLHF